MADSTDPLSPGGTTVENDIETVTVEATRLPNWQKVAVALAVALLIYSLVKN